MAATCPNPRSTLYQSSFFARPKRGINGAAQKSLTLALRFQGRIRDSPQAAFPLRTEQPLEL